LNTIELNSVSAFFEKKNCLKDVSLTIAANQHWAIIGANGSGKSALGKLLCGQLKAAAGSCTLMPRSAYVSFETVTEALDWERYNDDSDTCGGADQGTCAQDFILQDNPEQEAQLQLLAEKLHFSSLLKRGIKFLSTGEMRKVVVCQALLQNPQVLVLDEPFDGLDVGSVAVMKELIAAITTGPTQVVLLLNRISEVLPQMTHFAYLQKGYIVLSMPREELVDSTALKRLHAFHYQVPTGLPATLHTDPVAELEAGTPLLSMRDVNVSYGDKQVLHKFTWQVDPGQHWIVSGPNGSGKTTLLNLINGENTQAYANDITLFGKQKGSGETIWEIKQQLGFISTALQRSYRVSGTVLSTLVSGFFDTIGVYRDISKHHRQIAMEWLDLLNMRALAQAPFRKLSFGEQRLILLARAMIKHPRLLILDEPCQGLDEVNRHMILKMIDILGNSGKTQILYVTHHPEDRIDCMTHHLQLVPAPNGGSTAKISTI